MEIQIISGFLGAGKTTFLNKYLPLLSGKIAVVENEFGEVGLDGALIQKDVPVTELSAGCICCSLAIDLKEGIKEIAEEYKPDHIVIEPSGIGKLSDIIEICEKIKDYVNITINKRIVIVDACDCAVFAEEFGQFYSNQIAYANVVFLSNVEDATEEEKADAIECIRRLNPYTVIYEEDWRKLDGEELLLILNRAENKMPEEVDETDIMLMPGNQLFSNIVLEDCDAMEEAEIQYLLNELTDTKYGYVLRAKGVVPASKGGFWHFDYTNSIQNYEHVDEIPKVTNRVIVIGSELNKKELRKLIYRLGQE